MECPTGTMMEPWWPGPQNSDRDISFLFSAFPNCTIATYCNMVLSFFEVVNKEDKELLTPLGDMCAAQ